MPGRILTIFLAVVIMLGTFVEVKPTLARRGGDDSSGQSEGQSRGRGRGQDNFFEGQQRREGRRGQQHLQEGQDHPRKQGQERLFQDDSTGRGGKRGRGGDDR